MTALSSAVVENDDRTMTSSTGPAQGRPHGVGPVVAVLRRPILAALPVVLLLGPATVAAFAAAPTYGASAQVLVGRLDVESTAVPGFVAANEQLAGVYARLVSTEVIADGVADALGTSPGDVLSDVTASPIPESSIVVIEAESDTADGAVELARATAEELVGYVQVSTVAPVGTDALLRDFRVASEALILAMQRRDAAQAALTAAVTPQARASAGANLVAAQADVAAEQLRVDTLSGTFRSELRGSGERNSLRVISEATGTGSDRSSRVQLAVAVSGLAGLVLGVGIVTALENRRALRRLRRGDAVAGEGAVGISP